MKRHVSVVGMLLLTTVYTSTLQGRDPDPLPRAEEFTGKLGWTMDEALAWDGVLNSVFPYRGEVPEEDNVVFYYDNHMYLFWFQNRVWQIRADERWLGELDGVSMGMERENIDTLWGPPINDFDSDPTWTLPDRGYPVRIRLYFNEQGKLVDLYVYRSDW